MSEKWTLAEGFREVLTRHEDAREEDELATFDRKISLTIALMVVKAEGEKYVADGTGSAVMVQNDEGEIFERTFFPDKDETLEQLARWIVKGFGIDPKERMWEEGQQ